jgi:nucleoid DNA-binding protein
MRKSRVKGKMNLPELAQIVAKKNGIKNYEAQAILRSAFREIVRTVKQGKTVQLNKVGVFYMRVHRRHVAKNLPVHKGRSFIVPAHKHIRFRMSDTLRVKS